MKEVLSNINVCREKRT